jgi:hypothetical protein
MQVNLSCQDQVKGFPADDFEMKSGAIAFKKVVSSKD